MSRLESEQHRSPDPRLATSADDLTETLSTVACGLERHVLELADPATATSALPGSPAEAAENASERQRHFPPRPVQPKRSSSKKKRNVWSRLVQTLRSRRVRALLTCASLLLIGGLLVLNVRSTTPSGGSAADLAELELAEFGDVGTPLKPIDGFPPTLRTLDDSEVMPANRVDPPPGTGPRGAWLTGQIERETSSVVSAGGSWPHSNTAPDRVNSAAEFDSFPRWKP